MSGLRPPLLEERGLIPALRETVDRFGRDNLVHTQVSGRAGGAIPQDPRPPPPVLEERGLIPALRETVDRFGRDNLVHTEFSGRASGEIPQDLETLAYRVVQEALSNSAKHAHPVSVTVAVETTGGQLRVEIVDDGEGFDAGKAREYLQSGRVGLASMRERVELANGTFMVHSAPGRGTTVVASLPMGA